MVPNVCQVLGVGKPSRDELAAHPFHHNCPSPNVCGQKSRREPLGVGY